MQYEQVAASNLSDWVWRKGVSDIIIHRLIHVWVHAEKIQRGEGVCQGHAN